MPNREIMIKVLFLITLFVNIILFLWQSNTNKRPTSKKQTLSNPAYEKIVLVNELPIINQTLLANSPTENKTAPVSTTTETNQIYPINASPSETLDKEQQPVENLTTTPPSSYCYDMGPFTTNAEAIQWLKNQQLDVLSSHQYQRESKQISGYLVYYPAGKNLQEARNNVQLLKNKGISDLWLFQQGELKDIISLGLFIKEHRALNLQNKLQKMGLDSVKIMPRYKIVNQIYLQYTTSTPNIAVLSEKQTLTECDSIQER